MDLEWDYVLLFENEILLASGLCPIFPGVLLFHWLGILLSVQGTLWSTKAQEEKKANQETDISGTKKWNKIWLHIKIKVFTKL